MLTVHHLGKSQSERIVWLCEELELPYELKTYTRDPVTIFSPPQLRALHPMGNAPVLDDGDVRLAESGAIVDYILGRYGNGRLRPAPAESGYPVYLYWFHFANGSLQPLIGRRRVLAGAGVPGDHPMVRSTLERLGRAFDHVESRLGSAAFFAGDHFTAADIMTVFSLTTMRYFQPVDLAPYPNIRDYLARIAARPAYQDAMRKGDPGMPLKLT